MFARKISFMSLCLTLGIVPYAVWSHNGSGNQHKNIHQHSNSYANLKNRQIKALSSEEIQNLESGDGMGFALTAELNGYPGPLHVLELSETLNLSAEQKLATESLMGKHKQRALSLGKAVIQAEKDLNDHFASGSATPENLLVATLRAGELRSQLRAEHLATHIEQKRLLTSQQIKLYQQHRGYQ